MGLIYLLLAGFVIYQWRAWNSDDKQYEYIDKKGFWFLISSLANSLWIYIWLSDMIGVSVIVMLILLTSLSVIIMRTKMELWDAPFPIIAFVWWPFVFYFGWIITATITNISAYLTMLNWGALGISEVTWTIIMIIVATSLYLYLTWTRNLREAALVGAWALVALAVVHWDSIQTLQYISIICAGILIISSGIHGNKNPKASPVKKFQEWRS